MTLAPQNVFGFLVMEYDRWNVFTPKYLYILKDYQNYKKDHSFLYFAYFSMYLQTKETAQKEVAQYSWNQKYYEVC